MIEAAKFKGLGAIIWEQTAMESGEAVKRVHCNQ